MTGIHSDVKRMPRIIKELETLVGAENQLRHVRFFKDVHGIVEHMKKHADIMRPKFEAVIEVLERELGGLGIGSWIKPLGGYFISFDSMDGCAKAIVAKAKNA